MDCSEGAFLGEIVTAIIPAFSEAAQKNWNSVIRGISASEFGRSQFY